MTLVPRSLFGRVALVIFGALVLAHLLTFASILRERGELMRGMMSAYLVRDVAGAVAMLDRLPAAERAEWLPHLARPGYDYALRAPDATAADDSALARQLTASLAEALGAARVGPAVQATGGRGGLQLPLRLADGTPLTLQLHPPGAWISPTTTALLLLQLALLAAGTWWGVRLAVRPLTKLAAAADALAPTGPAGGAAIDEAGPQEVQQAARAFNAMQQRIAQQLAERLHLLAAISHDLQTPITRLRLRVEQLGDAAPREKLLADLQAMQGLVEEGLAYARSTQAAQEPPQTVDLGALLDGLVCDALDAGHAATLQGPAEMPLVTRVQALRRLLTNLIDNAIKFGGRADLQLQPEPHGCLIRVRDAGPGIPEAELARVMQPFYRLEASRSRDTGGTGLGLAIAQQLAQALGGRLSLHNRDEGGLEARLQLPASPPALPQGA